MNDDTGQASAEMPPHPTVLVIDDDAMAHDAYRAYLGREPVRLAHADGGDAGLRRLADGDVDLILCDVMMPELDGYAVCRAVKADPRGRTIPLVLVTALDDLADIVRGLDAGADEFLSKPVAGPVLRARVRAMLRIRQQYRALAAHRPTLEELLRARVDAAAAAAALSAREREVLDLLLLGRGPDEIGTALGITARTAKFHQANVLAKLGADSRAELLRILM